MTDSPAHDPAHDPYEDELLGGATDDVAERLAAIDDDEAEQRAQVLRAGLEDYELDEEDTNESGPYANTPTVRRYDGEGRLIAIERTLGQGSAVTRLRYDALDNLRGYSDAAGNVQPEVPPWNRLGYGNNAIEVSYVDVR